MSHRLITVHSHVTPAQLRKKLQHLDQIRDEWVIEQDGKRHIHAILVPTEAVQDVTDKLQNMMSQEDEARFVIQPIEAVLPKPVVEPTEEATPKDAEAKRRIGNISREELYDDVAKGAEINSNFLMLVVLSTIVAAIGLLEDNIAVVIGAMVIAPLLGPNMALALATALGDRTLMAKAIQTNLTGVSISFTLSILIGFFWPHALDSAELLARTAVGFDGVALALASGAAAVLSLVTGTSSVLVGVMVAVALLPPATTCGIMLGAGQWNDALGALMLLAVNIACVNLSAKLVFWYKGVSPRTWYEQQKAKRAMRTHLVFWLLTLLVLCGLILLRQWAG